jgi:5'-nucleotidase
MIVPQKNRLRQIWLPFLPSVFCRYFRSYDKLLAYKTMNILVTNDDGVQSGAMWALVRELDKYARVTVVAPDGERSGIGTAVTLFQPLHARIINPQVEGITTWAIDGSPADCVILGLGKLLPDADIVISGINPNVNLGEDVYISGTVGAATQGYFRGLPALAVSAPPDSQRGTETASLIASRLVAVISSPPMQRIFLNVNVPDATLADITGVKITRLARASHINTVEEGEHDGRKQYQLVRSRLPETQKDNTDIEAISEGYVSLTPLYTSLLDKPPQRLLKKISSELQVWLQKEH